ncbi:MAG: FG-GAP repeat domain-containing protein [Terriglobia bacterium]
MPFITEILPVSTQPGIGSKGAGSDLTLTAMGTGFINGTSAIYWNGKALPNPTTCTAANPPQQASCTVTVPAALIAKWGTVTVTVVNPTTKPAAGTSNIFYFSITNSSPSVTMSRKDFAVGSNPMSVAVGDFNGDGKLDLAVANFDSATVNILLGSGTGNFSAKGTPIGVAAAPQRVATGDFNGDGKLDLAVTNPRANTITVLLGDGTGGFTTASTAKTGSSPSWLAVGDFNEDGNLDLAVTNSGDDTVTILLGNGDGTFMAASASPPATGDTPVGVAVGDFNGDGKLDLVVANQFGGNLTILLGNGDGTFTPTAASPPAGDWPQSPAVGDFNGDGKLDIAVANPRSDTVTILLGDGTGNFTLASSPTTGHWPPVVTAGDLNGDGRLDLAVANQQGSSVTILLGDGAGNFTSAATPAVGASPIPVALADFNADGRLDLVTANSASNSISILLNLPAPATLISPGDGATNVDASSPVQFKWTTAQGALAYQLYVGITAGGNDTFDSGQIHATSAAVTLQPQRTYYARVRTKVGFGWVYSDSSFQTGPQAILIMPPNGATKVDSSVPVQFTWTSAAGASSYTLWVGTTLAGSDAYKGSPTQATSTQVSLLPGRLYYARIWTDTANGALYSDSSFKTALPPPTLTAPANGATDVNALLPVQFTWTTTPGPLGYYLEVGTTVGAKDVYASGLIQATSLQVIDLFPSRRIMHGFLRNSPSGGPTRRTVSRRPRRRRRS